MHPDTILAASILLGVPLLGIAGYLWLCAKMSFAKLQSPPNMSYFLIFAHYGVLLLMALIVATYGYSIGIGWGLMISATIGALVMIAVAVANARVQPMSSYHRAAAALAAAYPLLIGGFGIALNAWS